jgi:hypothetical protein
VVIAHGHGYIEGPGDVTARPGVLDDVVNDMHAGGEDMLLGFAIGSGTGVIEEIGVGQAVVSQQRILPEPLYFPQHATAGRDVVFGAGVGLGIRAIPMSDRVPPTIYWRAS